MLLTLSSFKIPQKEDAYVLPCNHVYLNGNNKCSILGDRNTPSLHQSKNSTERILLSIQTRNLTIHNWNSIYYRPGGHRITNYDIWPRRPYRYNNGSKYK